MRRKRKFRIDLGPLRGSSSHLQRIELARLKPARWSTCSIKLAYTSAEWLDQVSSQRL